VITKSGIHLGVALPQGFPDGNVDLDLVHGFARRAEALGFDDLWTLEQITGGLPMMEPVTLLANVAAVTNRVRLGIAVIVLNLRNPVQLSKALSSLDQLSSGRLTVGVGLGTNTGPYPVFGVDPDHRVSRFVEDLTVMQALWSEKSVDFEGRYFHLKGVSMEPKPLQQPLPVWFGARTEPALRRAARYGTGWMGAGSESAPDFLEELATMRRLLAEGARRPGTFTLSKRVYFGTGPKPTAALDGLRRWVGAFYGNPSLADRWGVWGTPDECVEKLGPLVAAGLDHILLNPVADNLEQLEIIAADIAPKL
jgi:probable F420-dependent oxidoreductase